MPKPKDRAVLKREVDAFNAHVKVGDDVLVKLDGKNNPTLKTKTTKPASILGGHSAVVWVENIDGAYLLERVSKIGG